MQLKAKPIGMAVATVTMFMLAGVPQASATPGVWDPPLFLSYGYSMAPAADTGPDGTTVVLVDYYVDGRYHVAAKVYTPGQGWGATRPLTLERVQSINQIAVAVGPGGTAVAAWSRYDPLYTGHTVESATYTPTDGWSMPVRLEYYGVTCVGPEVAIDAAGTSTVAFVCYSAFSWVVAVTRTSEGISVYSDQIGPTTEAIGSLSLAAGGDTTVAMWEAWEGNNTTILASHFTQAGGWKDPAVLDGPSPDVYGGVAGVDGQGAARAVWFRDNGTGARVWESSAVTAASWTAPAEVPMAPAIVDDMAFAVASDGTAQLLAVVEGTRPEVWALTRGPAGPWSVPTDLTPPAPHNATFPSLDADPAGGFAAAFSAHEHDAGLNYTVYSAWSSHWSATGGWSSSQERSEVNSVNVIVPTATAGAGHRFVFWAWRSLSTGLHHYVAHFEPVDVVAPPLTLLTPSDGDVVEGASVLVIGQTEPGAAVTVAGNPVGVGSTGVFSTYVALTQGVNQIDLGAADAMGNVRLLTIYVTASDEAGELRAQLDAAQQEVANLTLEVQRLNDTLQGSGAGPNATLEAALAELAGALQNVSALQTALDQANARFAQSQGNVTDLAAQLAVARTDIAQAQGDLAEASLEQQATAAEVHAADARAAAASSQVASVSMLAVVALIAAIGAIGLSLLQARRAPGAAPPSARAKAEEPPKP